MPTVERLSNKYSQTAAVVFYRVYVVYNTCCVFYIIYLLCVHRVLITPITKSPTGWSNAKTKYDISHYNAKS